MIDDDGKLTYQDDVTIIHLSVVLNTWTSERQMRSEHTALITDSLYHDTTSV